MVSDPERIQWESIDRGYWPEDWAPRWRFNVGDVVVQAGRRWVVVERMAGPWRPLSDRRLLYWAEPATAEHEAAAAARVAAEQAARETRVRALQLREAEERARADAAIRDLRWFVRGLFFAPATIAHARASISCRDGGWNRHVARWADYGAESLQPVSGGLGAQHHTYAATRELAEAAIAYEIRSATYAGDGWGLAHARRLVIEPSPLAPPA